MTICPFDGPHMMPHSTTVRPVSHALLLLALTLSLTGCPTGTSRGGKDAPLRNADYFLNAAKTVQGDRANLMRLSACEILVAEKRIDEALPILDSLRSARFSERDWQRFVLTRSDALVQAKRGSDALSTLKDLREPSALDKADYIRYLQLQSQANELDSNPFAAAGDLAQLHSLLSREQWPANNHSLWLLLQQIALPQLERLRTTIASPLLAGWADLAMLQQRYAREPDALKGALNSWRLQYQQHPANSNLPDELIRAQLAERISLKQIAVLLPLTGKLAASGRAARDGIMAAFYDAHRDDLRLRFYDSAGADVLPVYQQAVQDGADALIGPLAKEQLQQLLSLGDLPVPSLALNTIENASSLNFYQFGMPVEDEAEQVALRAGSQYKRALLISSDDAVGERAVNAFTQAFSGGGGEIAGTIKLGKDDGIEPSVTAALGIDGARQRKNALAQALGKELQFQPRRRQDVDVILLAAKPSSARRVKPFLNFHFANDIPVFATSYLFGGTPSPALDKDLNGIEFCDAPWLIDYSDARQEQRKTLTQALSNASGAQARLFALGYDAFLVLPEMSRLMAFPEYRVDGLSGQLRVNDSGQIKRELAWARFREGRLWNATQTPSSAGGNH